jgi:riboflavin biosynthesis pyrimidine reductase
VRFLLRERLLDELQLLVHPVIVSSGARLFEGYSESLPLTLARCHAHGNGVALRYTMAGLRARRRRP